MYGSQLLAPGYIFIPNNMNKLLKMIIKLPRKKPNDVVMEFNVSHAKCIECVGIASLIIILPRISNNLIDRLITFCNKFKDVFFMFIRLIHS